MLQRVLTGTVIAVVIIAILFSDAIVVSAFVGLLILIAQLEMSKVVGISDKPYLALYNIIFSMIFILATCLNYQIYIPLLSFVYIIALFAILLFNHENIKFKDILVSVFSMIYITAAMLHIVAVRNINLGNLYIFMIFIGAFATDTCAYFVGVLFGKHKLCEKVSPKKTIEGAMGGEIGSILLMLLFGYVVNHISGVSVNYVALALFGALSGLVSQLGDLTASIIKREFNVKDYGHILPGHGGVMDRMDSIILMAPLVYYFVAYLPVFVVI